MKKILFSVVFVDLIFGFIFIPKTHASGTFQCGLNDQGNGIYTCGLISRNCDSNTPVVVVDYLYEFSGLDNQWLLRETKGCNDYPADKCPILKDHQCLPQIPAIVTCEDCNSYNIPSIDCSLLRCPNQNPSPTPLPSENTGGGNTGTPKEVLVDLKGLLPATGLTSELTNFGLGGIVTRLLPFVYGISGVGLLIFLIAGGFAYLTSAGDPKKMEAAKGMITAAIIGFVIVIAAYWLTEIVNYIFKLGVPLG